MPSIKSLLSFATVLAVGLTTSCTRSAASYREAGDRLLTENKFADAAIAYRNALQKQPSYPEAAYGLGLAELSQFHLSPALASLSSATALKPDYREAMARLADVCLVMYVQDERRAAPLYDRAVQLANRLAELDPKGFDALRLRGQIALLNKQNSQAVELLTQAHAMHPLDRRVTLPLTQSLVAANREADAVKVANDALTKDPGFGPLYDMLYRFYTVSKRPADAEQILRRKVAANPDAAESHIQLAAFFAASNQRDASHAALKPLFDRPKDFPDANLRAADMYLRFAKPEDAKQYLEAGLRSDPARKATYLKRLGALAWAQNDRKKAVEYGRAAVEAAPEDDEARRFRASFLLEAGTAADLTSVIEDYSRLLKTSPDDKILHNQLGRAYRAKGDRDAAWKHFQLAIQRSPSYLYPRLSLAQISSEQRNNEQALRYVDEILVVDKKNIRVRTFRAGILRGLNRLSESRRELQALLAADPQNQDVQFESGLLYLAENRPREAEAVFSKLFRSGSADIRPAIALTEAFAAQKEFPKAIKLLEAEVERAPKDIGPRTALARMQARSGNVQGALDHYRQLVAAQPDLAFYHFEMGQLLLSAGMLPQALESLQKAAAIAPKDAVVQSALATGLHSARRLDAARTQYQLALALDSNNPDLLNNFAFLLAEQGTELDRGVDLAQKAIAKGTGNPSYSDTLGLLFIKQNNADKALAVLRPLVNKSPDNSTFRLHLAMALSKKGLREEARKELQAALTKQPPADEASAIRELLSQLG